MKYRIHYCRRLPSRPGDLPSFTPGESHRFIRSLEAESLGEVYRRMQGCSWSPNGEARSLIEQAGVSHTSMSMGDVAVDETGRAWVCDFLGWKEIQPQKAALILACSASKRDPADLPHMSQPIFRGAMLFHDDTNALKAPGVLVYNAPQWRIVRRWNPGLRVFALSGEYGLFDSRIPIQRYDTRMANDPPERWIYYHVLFDIKRILQPFDIIWVCVPGGGYRRVVDILIDTLRMGGCYTGRIEPVTTLLAPDDRDLPAHFGRTKALSLLCQQYARGRMPEAESMEEWAKLVLAGKILA